MSQKDRHRLKVLNEFHLGHLSRGEAASELMLSQRQISRIHKQYQDLSKTHEILVSPPKFFTKFWVEYCVSFR